MPHYRQVAPHGSRVVAAITGPVRTITACYYKRARTQARSLRQTRER